MDCEAYRELIFRAIDGGLSSEEQAVLSAHLTDCAGCRAVYEALAEASDALKQTEPVPEGFAGRVMEAVYGEKKIIDINEPITFLRNDPMLLPANMNCSPL